MYITIKNLRILLLLCKGKKKSPSTFSSVTETVYCQDDLDIPNSIKFEEVDQPGS